MAFIKFKDDTLGCYYSNAFCITIGEDTKLFDRTNPRPEIKSLDDLSIFIHEYWHYLTNISTIQGFKDFRLWQALLVPFSKTLQSPATGEVNTSLLSSGDNVLAISLVDFILLTYGDTQPKECFDYSKVNDFKITNVNIYQRVINIEGTDNNVTEAILDLDIFTNCDILKAHFSLGSIAIQEGLAYHIDRMVSSSGNSSTDAPPFPYLVLSKLGSFYLGRDLSNIELTHLSTLSLLTNDPPDSLIKLFTLYSDLSLICLGVEWKMNHLWENIVKKEYECLLPLAIDDLDELKTLFVGRGLIEYAINYISDSYKYLLRKRLESPFFDLYAFTLDKSLLFRELTNITENILPCDTIQEEQGNVDDLCKDFLVSFGNQSIWNNTGFKPTDFLRTLQCQLNFIQAHLRTTGFESSATATDKCPFYTVCDLPIRKSNNLICKEKPWQTYNLLKGNSCWYGTAVASSIGLVTVNKL